MSDGRERKLALSRKIKERSKGLGDTVAKAAESLGIKPCPGCKKRRKKLNDMFPYKK